MNRRAFFAFLTFWVMFFTAFQVSGQDAMQTSYKYPVTQTATMKAIPEPGENFNILPYVSGANADENGMLALVFYNAAPGKVKKCRMILTLRKTVVAGVEIIIEDEKNNKKLVKQLRAQFGNPYKIIVSEGKSNFSWKIKGTEYEIHYYTDESMKSGKAVIR